MTYLLDTNTVIYFFKGMGRVADNLLKTAPKDISIPAIVLYELEVGLGKSSAPGKRRKQLQTLTSLTTIIPFTEKEALSAAKIRATLEKKGTPIGPLENLIAGTAMANRCILVTHNCQEFKRIKGLQVIDWYCQS